MVSIAEQGFGQSHEDGRNIRVSGGLNEEQAAMDPSVLDVAFALSRELLSEICRVLILDIFDDRVPAIVLFSSDLYPTLVAYLPPTIYRCSPDHRIQGYRQC